MEQKSSFEYTYSAPEQEEIKRIREKYLPKEQDKMEQLYRLDESATRKGTVIALIVGITGTLIMGGGMSCCMVWSDTLMVPGIILGVFGMAMAGLALPLYNSITAKERARIAPEILRLTDELLK